MSLRDKIIEILREQQGKLFNSEKIADEILTKIEEEKGY